MNEQNKPKQEAATPRTNQFPASSNSFVTYEELRRSHAKLERELTAAQADITYFQQPCKANGYTTAEAYSKGVSAGKQEALQYTPQERTTYGIFVAQQNEWNELRAKLANAEKERDEALAKLTRAHGEIYLEGMKKEVDEFSELRTRLANAEREKDEATAANKVYVARLDGCNYVALSSERDTLRNRLTAATAQIETLTADNEALNGKLTAAILGSADEVTRLRSERDAAQAEVERLKKDIQGYIGAGQSLMDERDRAVADLVVWKSKYPHVADLGEAVRKENDQLRADLATAQRERDKATGDYSDSIRTSAHLREVIEQANEDIKHKDEFTAKLLAERDSLRAQLAEAQRWLGAYSNSDMLTTEPELRRALVKAQTQLAAAEARVKDNDDFMAFMAAELAAFPCCHENGTHDATPPMMWPELIACIVKKAVMDAEARGAEDKAMRERVGNVLLGFTALQHIPAVKTILSAILAAMKSDEKRD